MKRYLYIFVFLAFAVTADAQQSVTVSGYFTSSFTTSARDTNGVIIGHLYGRQNNDFMLNVANLTLDKPVAIDKSDAGFHFEAFFGQNAAVVKSTGLDLGTNADIWQAYITLNTPLSDSSRYMQIKAGKMATLMGVEVGEDILNPNLDVSYQDIFLEPFTETGVDLDFKFGPKLDAELRVSNGWDQVTDINTRKTFTGRIGVTPDDRTLIALVGYVGPEQVDNDSNDRLGANVVLYRKITSVWSSWLQLDYGQEDSVAAGGARARWYAAGFWTAFDIAPTATIALRGDYMNDRDGARTSGVLGFPANNGQRVGGVTVTLNLRSWQHALIRPEVRYDHSSIAAFDAERNQLSLGFGLSYLF